MPSFLIADDSEAKKMMLSALVKKAGMGLPIVTAKTTEEAKSIIAKEDIAFAFVDYEIPTEEGPAIIRALKAKNPEARIALVSSSDSDEYQTNAKEAGAEVCLCTSDSEDTFRGQIEELLEEWKMV